MNSPAFNRIVLIAHDGEARELSVEQFLALPIYERVHHILERRLRFYLDGQPVEQTEALRSMRR